MSTNVETKATKKALRDPRDVVRNAVARVEEEMPADAAAGLRDAWKALVAALALGPAPELRECDACHAICMRDAQRCGYCWAKLRAVDGVDPTHTP